MSQSTPPIRVEHAGFDWRRRRVPVDCLVVHESVTHSLEDCIAVLRRRHLGVHLAVTPDGEVLELAPWDHVVFHAGGELNGRSLGIEVISPYYPGADGQAPAPWQRVIGGRWAHRGRYVVPLAVQLEALWQLLRHLSLVLPLPIAWPGLVGRRFALSVVDGASAAPGVQAHIYTAHADGGVPVLYSWLRSRGLEPVEAYETVVRLATGARSWADVSPYATSPAAPPASQRSS